ncbi:Clp protease N-terminal domain-containing protein [Staphylococcus epidermidis]
MLFGRLTERAQRVLAHAQEEAIRLNHSNIGTEHLFAWFNERARRYSSKGIRKF